MHKSEGTGHSNKRKDRLLFEHKKPAKLFQIQ
jgi:hypothetical protein